ncbi:hypothetical protein AX16_004760 [Volvariella volvacea WC 439]|nr:hypothetical protein AX16_004760 [Volvariella volvacea WC 439]
MHKPILPKITLEYPLTRPFRWKWFGPLTLSGAFILFTFLIVLNVALTTYETVNIVQSDFNATQALWYDKYLSMRNAPPGILCEPHVFNIGDSFTTNYTLFQWTIESITKANAGLSGVSYQGGILEDCDITSLYINGDLRTFSVDYTAIMTCRVEGVYEYSSRTSFSVTSLLGMYSPLLGASSPSSSLGSRRYGALIGQLIQAATQDFGNRTSTAFQLMGDDSPVIISVQTDFVWCPPSLGLDVPCATQRPQFNFTFSSKIYQNFTVYQNSIYVPISEYNPEVVDATSFQALSNIVQITHAALRLDLGIASPNNILLYPSRIADTLFSTFNATDNIPAMPSMAYLGAMILKESGLIPVPHPGPGQIRVVYLCRAQRRKSIGSAIASVVAATLSMFSSAWGVYMTVAAAIAKRNTNNNICDAHLEVDEEKGERDVYTYSELKDANSS